MSRAAHWDKLKRGKFSDAERIYIAGAVAQDVRVADMAKHLGRPRESVAQFVFKYCRDRNKQMNGKGPSILPRDEPGESNCGYDNTRLSEIDEAARMWERLLGHERYDRPDRQAYIEREEPARHAIGVYAKPINSGETISRDRYYNMGRK